MASTKGGAKKDDDAVSDMGGMAKDKKKEKQKDGKKGK